MIISDSAGCKKFHISLTIIGFIGLHWNDGSFYSFVLIGQEYREDEMMCRRSVITGIDDGQNISDYWDK